MPPQTLPTSSEDVSVDEGLIYSAILQQEYESATNDADRRSIGHVGTPSEIARFMASLFSEIPFGRVRVLDAGAGVGILSAAFLDRIQQLREPRIVELVAYEKEKNLAGLLERNLNRAAVRLSEAGHYLKFTILTEDFILENPIGLTLGAIPRAEFDFAIMNPPYQKLSASSPQALAMAEIVHGQPNIYALFMASAALLLRAGGELVAITPRSYCNGLYFSEFRHWFFSRMSPVRVHLFDSRKAPFSESAVLQETMILHARAGARQPETQISTSEGRDLMGAPVRSVKTGSIIDDSTGQAILRIPANEFDQKVLSVVDGWTQRFQDLGLLISTGPVVTYRADEFIRSTHQSPSDVPLLAMHNVRPLECVWPGQDSSRDRWIRSDAESRKLLLPARTYVLVKRFSSKEEHRRIVAGVITGEQISREWVGLENHLNYIYRPADGQLSHDEAVGIAALLGSALMDRYFRAINGNTQVNATEIRTLPMPTLLHIERIGERVRALPRRESLAVEEVILDVLGVPPEVRDYLKGFIR